jgi:sulfatase modifying factor 1
VVLLAAARAAVAGDGAAMLTVPAGSFNMGSATGAPDEQPVHRVHLESFQIDRCEVTNGLYKKFMAATGSPAPPFLDDPDFAGDDRPVVGVTWEEAAAYAVYAGKSLPTEAQWEKAARGTDARPLPWGTAPLGAFLQGNFADETLAARSRGTPFLKGYRDGFAYTSPVGSFPRGASPYGVLDLAGNASEWCQDPYGADYYRHSPDQDPLGPTGGTSKVVRGGSWLNRQANLFATRRSRLPSATRSSRVGFRCVLGRD